VLGGCRRPVRSLVTEKLAVSLRADARVTASLGEPLRLLGEKRKAQRPTQAASPV
jgi:hypothetical protein